jgi:NAD(P)-dependent dehydrogenase (short-subunit alcohol dehydrogenase family)
MSQIVIVTGGAQGIGFGVCTAFAKGGAAVVIADINQKGADEAKNRLAEIGGGRHLALECDVTDDDSIERLLDSVEAELGVPDVLVNNAGICPFIHAMEMDRATWQRSLDVNLTAPFRATQAFARRLIDQKKPGAIVYITSLADTMTNPVQVDYAATKSGLRMMMAGFATALGPHGIRCNAVAPGHVRTPLTEHGWGTPEGQARIPKVIPLGRLGRPEDIGNACAYLASEQASYVNGITLRVDGGNSVWNP